MYVYIEVFIWSAFHLLCKKLYITPGGHWRLILEASQVQIGRSHSNMSWGQNFILHVKNNICHLEAVVD